MSRAHEIGPELEAALLRELGRTWDDLCRAHFPGTLSRDDLCRAHFPGTLSRPVMTLSDGDHRLGSWRAVDRTLTLSRPLLLGQPWGVVREVLKHEMAHQFVDEVLGISDETAHGPTFARVCAERGIDPAAAGLPDAGTGAGSQGSPVLRRISRLLALAESPNLHEANAAMNEARRLLLLHNLDAAAAARKEGYTFRHIGPVKARTAPAERILAGILSQHFFVSVIWVFSYVPKEGRRGRVLEVAGTPANLEVAAYVYDFLVATAARLWNGHKRAHGIQSDRERRRFLAGVMTGFREKLSAGARQSRREGLICVPDADREAYLRRRYPRQVTSSGPAILRTPEYEHGRAAGKEIELRRPVGGEPPRGPRLLTAPSA